LTAPTAPLRHRGINYDTGTVYEPGVDSRPDWSSATLRRHLDTISGELHANAVNLFGSHPERLLEAASAALGHGLDVWVQPRLPDADRDATVALVCRVAEAVEPLRLAGGSVRLNVGCELTVFTAGLIPGRGFERRARRLRWMWPLLPLFDRRLDRLLDRAAAAARARFGGEITYGAGSWESVSWRRFDAVGLNHYRDGANHHRYAAVLALARRRHDVVYVTEFGCCSYPGAETRGAEADAVVDWHDPDGPVVVGAHRRDESVQADAIGAMLDTFTAVGVDGAFVFEFSEPSHPRHVDPRRDLDVASFGIVAVERHDGPAGTRWVETPKAAFVEIARRYREDDAGGGDADPG
jgi:hypothetical protein